MNNHLMSLTRRLSSALAIFMILFIGACTTPADTYQSPVEGNQPPVIRFLTAQDMTMQKQVAPSKGLEIQCVATDADNDSLNYKWSATEGRIENKGDRVFWTAPDAIGEQTITVVVTDGKGGQATRSLTIMVTTEPSQYPIITSVTCRGCGYNKC